MARPGLVFLLGSSRFPILSYPFCFAFLDPPAVSHTLFVCGWGVVHPIHPILQTDSCSYPKLVLVLTPEPRSLRFTNPVRLTYARLRHSFVRGSVWVVHFLSLLPLWHTFSCCLSLASTDISAPDSNRPQQRRRRRHRVMRVWTTTRHIIRRSDTYHDRSRVPVADSREDHRKAEVGISCEYLWLTDGY